MKRESRYGLLNQPGQESWLTSYGDLMTILLVFFVLLLSTNHVSAIKFERVKEALKGNTEKTEGIAVVESKLRSLVEEASLNQNIQIESLEDSLEIRFADHLLFESGKSAIKKESHQVLSRFMSTFNELPGYARIAIEGYTDDNPIKDRNNRSNWHLSANRSLAVMEFFDRKGICRSNCEIRGYGEYKPFFPNRDDKGVAIIDNQKKNRRVLIRIF